ncbi:putative metal-binding motif-containing protein [Candidatus Woesearchaeota archaeon]|nr:putative metal-binding motif-containing protein [Candidatus Woesearchaeota archaeon]
MLEKLLRSFAPVVKISALVYTLSGCGNSELSNTPKNIINPDSTYEATDLSGNEADAGRIDEFVGKDEVTYQDGFSEEIIEPACEKKKFYWDGDEDGFPIKYGIEACNPPGGYISVPDPWNEDWNGDCNDSNDKIHPFAKETCNGIDDNCNGNADEGFLRFPWHKDNDGDGFGNSGGLEKLFCNEPTKGYVKNKDDCNDNNSYLNPVALELCNGIDDNCDNNVDETCECIDGTTQKCGLTDGGECGYGVQKCVEGTWGECKGAINPVEEECDGLDNNCNGLTDENLTQDCSNQCGPGDKTCVNGSYVNCTAPKPKEEICNGEDDNCNGAIDEGLVFTTGYKDADSDGFGSSTFKVDCKELEEGYAPKSGDCNDNDKYINPGAVEVCDGLDNNCNSSVDEGLPFSKFYEDVDGDGFGNPDVFMFDCGKPEGFIDNKLDCDDSFASYYINGVCKELSALACNDIFSKGEIFGLDSQIFEYKGADKSTKSSPKIKIKSVNTGETLEYAVGMCEDKACFTLKWQGECYKFVSASNINLDDFDIMFTCDLSCEEPTDEYAVQNKTSDCTEGWKCFDTIYKVFQESNCQLQGKTYCLNGCLKGQCQ